MYCRYTLYTKELEILWIQNALPLNELKFKHSNELPSL